VDDAAAPARCSGRWWYYSLFAIRYSSPLVLNSCDEVTTSLDPFLTHQPRNAIFILLHGAGTSSLYSHCISLRAGSVYDPAACVVCFRDVSAITSQLRPHAFLAFLYWTPPSLVVSSRQSADRSMLRIALPKIPSTSWPGQTRCGRVHV
jgi:hypothetical protein